MTSVMLIGGILLAIAGRAIAGQFPDFAAFMTFVGLLFIFFGAWRAGSSKPKKG